MATLNIAIDISQAISAAGALQALPGTVAEGVARGVNAAGRLVRTSTVSAVVSQVNLTAAYVEPRLTIKAPATEGSPRAILSAPVRETILTRFGAKQQATPDEWTAAKYKAKFGSLFAQRRPSPKAPLMGWTTRTGSAKREIAPGQKAAGIAVAIRAGGTAKTLTRAFVMPLKSGNGNGVFITPRGGGKPKARYGPSVYQVAQRTWAQESDQIAEALQGAVGAELEASIAEAMGTA